MKNLKCVLVLLTMLIISVQCFAQAPQKFNYQAVCRNNAGELIVSQAVSLRLSVHDLTAGGAVLYMETHNATTNNFGLVTLAVGGGTVGTGNFLAIDWSTGDKYLEVELDAGSGFTSMGTSQLLSVPYAIHAKTTDSISGGITEIDPQVGLNTTNNLSKWNGTSLVSSSVFDNGQIGIGTTNPQGALDVTSTTGAFMPPRMTTTQRDAFTPQEGMIIYNTSISKFQGYQVGPYILQIDTGFNALPRSIVAGYWVMHQSFTAPSSVNITDVEILTETNETEIGTLRILAGNGTGGSVLYTQSITYASCGTGICVTHITLTTPFAITNGTSYTLKFSADTGGLSTFTNTANPYSGGQVWQNTNSKPGEDMYLKLFAPGGISWVNFY